MYSAVTWASQTYWPSLWLLMCKTLCLPAVKAVSRFWSKNKERKKDRRKEFYTSDAPTSFILTKSECFTSDMSITYFITCSHRIKKPLLLAHARLVSKQLLADTKNTSVFSVRTRVSLTTTNHSGFISLPGGICPALTGNKPFCGKSVQWDEQHLGWWEKPPEWEALLATQRCHSLGEMLMRLAHHFMKISFAARRAPWQKELWWISQKWFKPLQPPAMCSLCPQGFSSS